MSNDHNDIQSGPSDSLAAPPVGQSINLSAGHLSDGQESILSITPSSLEIDLSDADRDDPFAAVVPSPTLSALEFRVLRPGAPVRRLRLTGNRYTFGSGEGCSIRLDDESLRPMHAVLLRDAHRILMRAYSVPLECNGSRVTEVVLRLGDLIRMGHYRFELLAAPGLVETIDSPTRGLTGNQFSSLRQSAPSDAHRESHLRDRLTELSQQWHARHAECEVRESRCDQRETELHGRESELWGRAEHLQQREGMLVSQEAAAREIQETYAATQQELKDLRLREVEASETLKQKETELLQKNEQLLQRQAELEQHQAEWQEREEHYAERSAEAQRKLEHTQQQAQSASDAVGRMREEFATLSEQLTELRERHSELQERERNEQIEHDRLRAELEAERDLAVDDRVKSEAKCADTENDLLRVDADLESTREELAKIRQESKECQQELSEKLRATSQELQAAREEAETSRRAAEEDQAYTEKRIVELEEQLFDIQEKRLAGEKATKIQIEELQQDFEDAEEGRKRAELGRKGAEEVAEELRNNIRTLQESVAEANQEVSQIRVDYEGANASIRQLELLVDQTKNNQSAQHDTWEQESDQLRQTIEGLSVQLSGANAELSELRIANEALSNELSQAQTESSDGQLSAEQAAIDSEQFGLLEKELDSARKEIENLQRAHAETVSRLETERDESESVLRDEIEQLRDEIASVQQAAEERVEQIIASHQLDHSVSDDLNATDIKGETAGHSFKLDECDALASNDSESVIKHEAAQSMDSATNPLVESGESVWRMESEQSIENRSHFADWSQDQDVQSTFDPSDSFPSDSDRAGEDSSDDYTNAEGMVDSEIGSGKPGSNPEEGDTDRSVSWHDEPPESAVADAIDDIEHNVEQAISDYDKPAESDLQGLVEFDETGVDETVAVNETVAEDDSEVVRQLSGRADSEGDSPLSWSAYMPGGDESPAAQQDENEASFQDQDADDLELGDDVDNAPNAMNGESDGFAEAADWDGTFGDTSSRPASIEGSGEIDPSDQPSPVGEVGQSTESLSESVSSSDDPLPAEDVGPAEGSLAAMLIRDLTNDSNNDVSVTEDVVETEDDSTFVIDRETEFASEAEGEESVAWNFQSPDYHDDESEQESEQESAHDAYNDSIGQDLLEDDDVDQSSVAISGESVPVPALQAEDDSIEAYMSRLLQRVQGEELLDFDEASAEPVQESSGEAAQERDGSEVELSLDESLAVAAEEQAISNGEPLAPRSEAPELKRDLSAMRDLANQSARNAVARSIRVQARDTQVNAAMKGGLTVGFIAMAIGVYFFIHWSTTIKTAMIGSFLVLACVFGQEGFVLWREARRRLSLANGSPGGSESDQAIAEEKGQIADQDKPEED